MANNIGYSEISKLIRYEPDTGKLFWKVRPSSRTKAGDEAGSSINSSINNNYRKLGIRGKVYLSHRIAWLLHHGDWPKQYIDHINGVKNDNRIVNLRDVSASTNCKNVKKHVPNTSGITGVGWHKQFKKWTVRIGSNGSTYSLGHFDNIEDAAKARKQGEKKYGYTERHGQVKV